MGKISTETLLIIGVAAVGVYLLTRPKTPTPVYTPTYPAGYNPYAVAPGGQYGGNATAQDIAAGGTALSSITNALSNAFS